MERCRIGDQFNKQWQIERDELGPRGLRNIPESDQEGKGKGTAASVAETPPVARNNSQFQRRAESKGWGITPGAIFRLKPGMGVIYSDVEGVGRKQAESSLKFTCRNHD